MIRGDSGVDNVEITNARQVSENDIQIEGNIAFQRGWKISRTVSFLITMTANSAFNEYEKKNLELIQKLEANSGMANCIDFLLSSLYTVFIRLCYGIGTCYTAKGEKKCQKIICRHRKK